jgi:hypothetical protein
MPSFGPSGAIYGDIVSIAASAVRSGSGSSGNFGTSGYGTLRLLLDVTAAVAPTSLNVTVETSDVGAVWYPAGTFAAKTTAPSSERKTFGALDRLVRVSWVIVGTSFTFSVGGEALGFTA